MPTLPYPLLKLEVQMLKQSLLPQCPTNELGGYQGIPVADYEVLEIEKNQPKWRAIWLRKERYHKLHYFTASHHMRIDPTFYQVRRWRDWETFERITHSEQKC